MTLFKVVNIDFDVMGFKHLGLSFVVACFLGIPVSAEENKFIPDVENSLISNIPSFVDANPLCLDHQPAIKEILVLIDQKNECGELSQHSFGFNEMKPHLKELTIHELAGIILKVNPNIRAYQNMFLSSIYSSRAAWATALGFNLSLAATPSRVYSDTYTKDLIDTYNYSLQDSVNTSYSGSLSLTINLLNLAEIYNAKATAETVGSNKAVLQEQAIETVKSATSSFIDYWYYNNLSKVYITDISNSLTSLVFAYGLYQIGQNSVADLSSIFASLRASQANYLANLTNFNSAINNLRRYLNELESRYFLPDKLELNDIAITLAKYDDAFVDKRLALDPQNLQNEANRLQYNYLSKSEMMNYMPTISAGASLSPSHQYSTTHTSTYTDTGSKRTKSSQLEDEVDIAAKIEFSWKFFDGFSSLNQSKSYSKKSEYYKNLYDDRHEELLDLSRTYIVSNNLYFNQINFLRSEAKASKINYDKTLISYNFGFDDTTSLIQSLSGLSNAKQSLISNIYNYYVNYINLQALFQADMFDFELPEK